MTLNNCRQRRVLLGVLVSWSWFCSGSWCHGAGSVHVLSPDEIQTNDKQNKQLRNVQSVNCFSSGGATDKCSRATSCFLWLSEELLQFSTWPVGVSIALLNSEEPDPCVMKMKMMKMKVWVDT
ncbi:unnamed protein product [Pleuronectes platessa]|uniref:Secreted protein n=1 Tax=Pleuronectes platessa TaxID=8262 RepID=A0A9N7YG53_PLEPL|nr:unnamed protein product [Pleuronectes platessa]